MSVYKSLIILGIKPFGIVYIIRATRSRTTFLMVRLKGRETMVGYGINNNNVIILMI